MRRRLPMIIRPIPQPMPKPTTIILWLRRRPHFPIIPPIRHHILFASPFVRKKHVSDMVELSAWRTVHGELVARE
jgi:hypothetical protein